MRYSNPRVDALLEAANAETDQLKRPAEYIEVQKNLATDVPGIPLWYPNNEVVHSTQLTQVKLNRGDVRFPADGGVSSLGFQKCEKVLIWRIAPWRGAIPGVPKKSLIRS